MTSAHLRRRSPGRRGSRPGRTPAGRARSPATVVTVPATPTSVPAVRDRDAVGDQVERGRRCRPRRRRPAPAVGGSSCRCRSVIRTQPMSTDRDALDRVGAEHDLGRAAADVDDEVRRLGAGAAQLAGRAEEGQLGLARRRRRPPARRRGSRSTPVDELGPVRGVPGGRGGDHPDPLGAELVDRRRVRRERRERALERLRARAGRSGRRPGRAGRSPSGARRRRPCRSPASRSATSSRIEFVPQSIAATRVIRVGSSSTRDARTGRATSRAASPAPRRRAG